MCLCLTASWLWYPFVTDISFLCCSAFVFKYIWCWTVDKDGKKNGLTCDQCVRLRLQLFTGFLKVLSLCSFLYGPRDTTDSKLLCRSAVVVVNTTVTTQCYSVGDSSWCTLHTINVWNSPLMSFPRIPFASFSVAIRQYTGGWDGRQSFRKILCHPWKHFSLDYTHGSHHSGRQKN